MNTRKLLINAIVSGNIEEIKKLKKHMRPALFILSSTEGNYFTLENLDKGTRIEISKSEIEELKNCNDLIIFPGYGPKGMPKIATCEDEIEM